jgi:hypothetical protein
VTANIDMAMAAMHAIAIIQLPTPESVDAWPASVLVAEGWAVPG